MGTSPMDERLFFQIDARNRELPACSSTILVVGATVSILVIKHDLNRHSYVNFQSQPLVGRTVMFGA
jgi:hypothetical protein